MGHSRVSLSAQWSTLKYRNKEGFVFFFFFFLTSPTCLRNTVQYTPPLNYKELLLSSFVIRNSNLEDADSSKPLRDREKKTGKTTANTSAGIVIVLFFFFRLSIIRDSQLSLFGFFSLSIQMYWNERMLCGGFCCFYVWLFACLCLTFLSGIAFQSVPSLKENVQIMKNAKGCINSRRSAVFFWVRINWFRWSLSSFLHHS